MGLVLSDRNIPLGYELFPGNTWEGHTVDVFGKRNLQHSGS